MGPDIEETRGLDFNLSHTAGLIVLAIARNIELGVDVENIRRSAVLEAVDHYFAPAEASRSAHCRPPCSRIASSNSGP
jgi:4'-phosphopantetheinyl transferase